MPAPFASHYRRGNPAFGPYPRRLGEPVATPDDLQEWSDLRPCFSTNQLELLSSAASKSHSIAVNRDAHSITRLLVGKDVLHWLVKHWAARFNRNVVNGWSDAALYAAQALNDDSSLACIGEVLASLETTRQQFLEEYQRFDLPDSAHTRKVLVRAGPTAAARTADAYDVAFSDFDGNAGYVAVEVEASVDLRAVGFLVMAKRLGVLNDDGLDLADVADVKRRLLAEVGLDESAGVRERTDALLATIDQHGPTVPTRVAAEWHADRILETYMRDRGDGSPPHSFAIRLARGSIWAWHDRWALNRFIGLPLDAPLDAPETWARYNLDTPTPGQVRRLNQVLGHVSGPDTDVDWHGWAGIGHHLGTARPPVLTLALDDAFAQEAMRHAQSDANEREAALELLRWGTQPR